MRRLIIMTASAGLLGLMSFAGVGIAAASDGAFQEIDCKEYHALTGYRVCAVQKKVWIRKERYNEMRIERDRKLCRAEMILTYGKNTCLSDAPRDPNGQAQCLAQLDQCDIRHNSEAIKSKRSASALSSASLR